MFALRVTIDRAETTLPAPELYTRITRRPLAVDTRLEGRYGFCVELEGGLAIGESLAPVDQSRLREIVSDSGTLVTDRSLLGNDILALVYIDFEKRTAAMIASISSTRPYYYTFDRGSLLCSTSIKALAELGVPMQANEEVVPEFLVYRFVTPPQTLYQGVSKLIGGQAIHLDLAEGEILDDRRYPFESPEAAADNDHSIRDRLNDILTSQVDLSLAHAERPGVLLSGGLDSSLLASLAITANRNVTSASSSFSFVDENDAESEYALSVARHLGIRHSVYEGSAEDYLSGLVESIWHAEEPVHHLQSVMLYLLFKHHAQQDLMICGEGADGLFGNDAHIKLDKYGNLLTFGRRTGALHVYRQLLRLFGVSGYRWKYFSHYFGPDLNNSSHYLWTLGQYGSPSIVKQRFGCDDEAITASHRALMQPYSNDGLLKQITIQSLLCEGFVTMFVWGKLAESRGLALHYPFTTPELIDYIVSVPWEKKLREPKYFIRSLLRAQQVPESFITRPKMSFGFPYRYWALPETMFQPIVDMAGSFWGEDWLRSLQSPEAGRAMVLWNVLSLHLWREMFIEGKPPESLAGEIIERYRRQERNR